MISPLLQRAGPEPALALRAAAERQHHRQRDLALAEIVADVLAELGRLAAVVEHVVDQLEGDAEVHAERAAGGVLGLGPVGQDRADLAGGGEQLGGLGADHGEIFVLGGRGVLGGAELHHLALGDDGGGVRQDVERAHRADLDHHLERLAEQEVADQHARLVAPEHARGGPAAPHVALVDHVVVQQRRGVHELDRGGELDVAVAGIAGQARHRQGQHRPQPLAAGRDQVVGDLRDHRHLGAGARQNLGVDPLHVGRDELDQAVDGGVGRTEWDDDGHVRAPDCGDKVREEDRNAMLHRQVRVP